MNVRQSSPGPPLGVRLLGAQDLATLCPATRENLTAILGGHTCAETMTALADKTARLIRTLHCSLSAPGARPFVL